MDDVFGICKTCGNCCRQTIPLISESDIKRWKTEKRRDILKQVRKFQAWHTFERKDGACIFFNVKCLIHDTKPESCRNFPKDREAGEKLGCKLVLDDRFLK